jgi:glycosyltransferase involved in cell wall biosynthesis
MRIVWVSDWSHRPVPTGFGRASLKILSYLKERGHEVIEIGVGYEGYGDGLPWPTYPTTAYGGRLEGQDVAPLVAAEHSADALVLFMDFPYASWAVQYHDRQGNALDERVVEALDKRRYALCLYTPVDGACIDGKVPRVWEGILRRHPSFDALSAPSKFGITLLSNASGMKARWLPHGVDTDLFRPDQPQVECRRRLGIPEENFTLLYVGVNKHRKQLPAFYETAAKVQALLPDVPLTVMVNGNDRDTAYDLQGLVDAYGLEARGAACYRTENLTDQALATLYGAADVLVHTSGGEGFGLPIVEAMACRLPALVTDYSAMAELVPDNEMGWCRIPVKALIPYPANGIAWAWPDTDAAAERLVAFWKDRGLRVRLRKACFEKSRAFAWPRVLPWFENWLETAIQAKRSAGFRLGVERIRPDGGA